MFFEKEAHGWHVRVKQSSKRKCFWSFFWLKKLSSGGRSKSTIAKKVVGETPAFTILLKYQRVFVKM